MKKVLFVLAVAILCLQVTGFSQKTKVGVTAGITTANMYGHVNGVNVKGDSKAGFTFGLILDAPLGKSHWSFQPGIHYVQKGKTISETEKAKNFLALRYAELHANFVYNSNKKTNFFVGAGPSIAFDLPSQYVLKTSNATAANINAKPKYTRAETSINFGKDAASDFRGYDYGVNGIFGFRLPCGFYAALNYTLGIRNLVPIEKDGNETRNGCFGVRIGILFNNK
jgi:hypothetical protein